MFEEFFFDGVPVEPGDRAQPAGDGGPGPAAGFHVAGEALDVGPPDLEQPQVLRLTPVGELAQVQRVSRTSQAGIASQEPGQRQPLCVLNTGSATAIAVDAGAVVAVIGYLPGRAETPEAGPAKPQRR
jgi:hypothetical protein